MSLHRDERGTISIVTVFAIFMFTILLGMVMNVARHADDKLRMQNAADAAAQSGGTVLARGMNSVAFSNHLLCEIFALTAYMREAARGDQGTASLVPEILEQWRRTGQVFQQHGASSGFQKFERLGRAIQQKVPLEQDVVDAYVDMAQEHANMTLPVLEHILAGPNQQSLPVSGSGLPQADPLGGYIPRFQRAVVRTTPALAHLAADEIARRHGARVRRQHAGQRLQSRIWRTDVRMLGQINERNPLTRTVGLIDPSPASNVDAPFPQMLVPYTGPPPGQAGAASPSMTFFQLASEQRRELARHYLERWIRQWMGPYFDFDRGRDGIRTAKMSNLINLWRSATCEHLNRLLNEEYPLTNLPHVIREQPAQNGDLERTWMFVTVVYWPHLEETFPGLFKNLLERDGQSDALAFAQATVFVPQARLRKAWLVPQRDFFDNVVGWGVHRDNWPADWDGLNQNWMTKLVPATSGSVPAILQANPQITGFRPPRLGNVTVDQIRAVNMH